MCMMEGTWLSIEEDDSSNPSFADSDVIDSETEAELYSIIHYEESLHSSNCQKNEIENVPVQTSDKMNNVYFTEKNRDYETTESVCSVMPVSQIIDNTEIEKITHDTAFPNKLAQKLNLVKKEKSNIDNKISNALYSENLEDAGLNQTLKDTSLNNKRKRESDHALTKGSILAEKHYTDLSDSSDNIIWTEVDETAEKEFQTNLYEDVIYLSSDCESEFQLNCPSPQKQSEKNLRNLSMPNIKIGENIKDVWFVNDKDLYRPKKSNSKRYHHNAENTCTNCNGKGHNSRICPVPKTMKCFICGGGHPASLCVNRICGKCFGFGHGSRQCWIPYGYCTLCNMKGHIKENCPDIWRRYHLTTCPGKIVRGKRIKHSELCYCWNCGEFGHFGAICREPRGPKQCLPTWPCVVTYEDPEDLLKKRFNGYYNRSGSFRKGADLNQRIITDDGGNFNAMKSREAAASRKIGARLNFNAMKKKKKKKNKLNHMYNNLKKALGEKDFPRTPKNVNHSNNSEDDMPESVIQLLAKKEKQRVKNRKRKLKRRLERLAQLNGHPLQQSQEQQHIQN